jgi:hypothetical protein
MRNLLVAAVVLGAGGYFGAKYYVQYKVAKDLDSVVAQARPFVDVEYEQVVATMRGELRVEGVTVRLPQFDDALTVSSVNVLTPGFLFLLGFDNSKLEIPERFGVELEGLRASVDADFMRVIEDLRAKQVGTVELTAADTCAGTYGLTRSALKRLGYHELVGDMSMGFRRADGHLVVELGAHVENMYDIDVEVELEGLTDPTAIARGARPLLAGGRIDYVDRSLNERILKHCAEQQVMPEDVIAAQLRQVQKMARDGGMELDALILAPYTDFLLGKQRFTLTSDPVRPVDLTRLSLYKPSDVPNLLNLTAEAI